MSNEALQSPAYNDLPQLESPTRALVGTEGNESFSCIKIGFFLWSLEALGGSERVVYDIARKLNRQFFTPVIISHKDGHVRKLYENAGIPVFIVPKKSALDLNCVITLRRLLFREKIELVNAHHLAPLLDSFAATRFSGVKVIYTEHSVWQIQALNPLLRAIFTFVARRVDASVAISRQLFDYYRKEMPYLNGKAHLVVNGIDIELFGKSDRNHTRQDLGLPEDAKIVGIVANLRPEKNHKLLVSAFSQLAQEEKRAHLLVIGLDCMDGEIQSFAKQKYGSDRIHFLGPRDDVPDLLRLLDVYCLPSVNEGLPLTLLEAMAAGVPVIGTDVIGINEVITPFDNGILVPPDDEKSLAEAMKRIVSDGALSEKLSAGGMSYVTKHHDLDVKIRQYETLFASVCSRS
jgi:glycosyltransferase involved in cell wall biosynthesis